MYVGVCKKFAHHIIDCILLQSNEAFYTNNNGVCLPQQISLAVFLIMEGNHKQTFFIGICFICLF